MQVSGKVTSIRVKNGVSKAGNPYAVKYITIEGWSESNGELGVGFDKVQDGQLVSYEVVRNNNEWQVAKPAQAPQGGQAAPQGNTGGEVNKSDNIIRQNALSHATQIVCHVDDSATEKQSASELSDLAILVAFKLANFAAGRLSIEDHIANMNKTEE